MALRPEISVGGGLATAGLVYAIYARALPPTADLRLAGDGDPDAEAARKTALWTSFGMVSAISLLTKDPTIFVVGGAMTVATDWVSRQAIWVVPELGSAAAPRSDEQMVPTEEMQPETYGPSNLQAV